MHPHAIIEAADGLPQGVDGVGEGEQRINRLEEIGYQFQRVEPGCAGDLHEHQDDAEGFAHMLERDG